ncbi:filament-like plant protein 7 isoform X1 [Ricinus communis]|uniref:filament-like plant protein 7 isoform X1 n=2 Tax=Ricinus communis TaxID=3988 RepID=UPI000772CAA7|nr:filament-like plant protein 7 isoform X1 [Ricinus communis]|eukprot:XP_015577504.1 filament-like plant protein 7 isoform X1 [Ricinus communis]
MDHKSTWLWRKKSTEKMIVSSDKVNMSPKENEDEIHTLLTDKVKLENDLKSLNEKLSSALSENNAKDDLIKKQMKMTEEAMAGLEKAEAKAVSLKQELDKALQQRAAGEERLTQTEAALKECMQQLHFVRQEQERRIHDAVVKASGEFEKSQMILEEKLADNSKRLAKIGVENTHLSKALLAKEKTIDDLTTQKAQVDADISALMTRLESIEKDNASLKYEVRVLEKELEIRNEEREFNRRTADASRKQHLESVKKIAKLESECQRLRLLVRKRLPGPAALAKMKSEVDILGRDSVEMRRRRTSSSPNGLMVDSAVDRSADTLSKQINFLTEQLCAIEEENKTLKEALNRKANELQTLRSMYARAASKLSQVDFHFDELSKSQTCLEPSRSGLPPHEVSLTSMSDVGSDDKISCAESWASALISELDHFKHGKQGGSPSAKTVGASDINLMDDFIEMERLAIVSVDQKTGSPHVTSDDAKEPVNPIGTGLNGHPSQVTGGEIIGSGVSDQEIKSTEVLINKAPDWLQNILKAVLEQTRMTQRKPDKILEDVKGALADISNGRQAECADTRESSKNSPHVAGYISWKPIDESAPVDSSCGITDDDAFFTDTNNQQFQSDLGKSIQKIIEHLEGITSPNYDTSEALSRKDGSLFPYKNETSSGYMVRVFQWKTSELGIVVQQFVHACCDLVNGKSDVNRFAQELSAALDWIVNHCFSLQDVSSMKDAIKKHFEWDETRSESEAEAGTMSQFSQVDKLSLPREQLSCLPMVSASNGLLNFPERDEFHSTNADENKKLRDELINIESTKKDLEGRLQSAVDKSETLMNQLQDSEETIASLQKELDSLKMSKAMSENQNENQKLMREDLDTQFAVAKAELDEARKLISSLEVELENKTSCCEELEATCLELQLQLESIGKKEIPDLEEAKQLRTDWEITAASEKLAECQETILNLGKQLKALAAPSEASLFDKVISSSPDRNGDSISTNTTLSAPRNKLMNQRSSLRDQMLAEDNAKTKSGGSPQTKESDNVGFVSDGKVEPLEKILILNETKVQDDNVAIRSLAIVPRKKRGGGNLWRKLLWRKKNTNSKNPTLPFPSQ